MSKQCGCPKNGLGGYVVKMKDLELQGVIYGQNVQDLLNASPMPVEAVVSSLTPKRGCNGNHCGCKKKKKK